MTGLARKRNDLLSDKGAARPMLTWGVAYRDGSYDNVTWHPAATRRLALQTSSVPGAERGAKPAVRAAHSGPASLGRVRASLRLGRDLHERLKYQASVSRRTQQSVLLQALEDYLDRQPEAPDPSGERRCPRSR